MRQFTKKHNDLEWLFPFAKNKTEATKIFNEFEQQGKYLFEMGGYDAEHKDIAIDSFMKGCSVAMQLYYYKFLDRAAENINNNIFGKDKKTQGRFLEFTLLIHKLASFAPLSKSEKIHAEYIRKLIEHTGFDYDADNETRMKFLIDGLGKEDKE